MTGSEASRPMSQDMPSGAEGVAQHEANPYAGLDETQLTQAADHYLDALGRVDAEDTEGRATAIAQLQLIAAQRSQASQPAEPTTEAAKPAPTEAAKLDSATPSPEEPIDAGEQRAEPTGWRHRATRGWERARDARHARDNALTERAANALGTVGLGEPAADDTVEAPKEDERPFGDYSDEELLEAGKAIRWGLKQKGYTLKEKAKLLHHKQAYEDELRRRTDD